MDKKYRFKCGCELPYVENQPEGRNFPLLKFDVEYINYQCPHTWQLIQEGRTKGGFQIESQLLRHWSKEISPKSMPELADLISLVRPGTLKAKLNGKSLTQHYADRKSGKDEIGRIHPIVDKILAPTQGVLVYQEQAMAIVVETAGFTLEEADTLRKAAGKKLASEMAKVKTLYLEKAKALGKISYEEAEKLFSWIEQSQRYSFNKCVSGDTRIVGTDYNNRHTIESMYRTRTDKKYAKANGDLDLYKKWNSDGHYGKSLSLDGDKVVPNNIVSISPAGLRAVIRITLENGLNVKVTNNHKFPTVNGEVLAENLVLGDKLICVEKNRSPYEEKIILIESAGYCQTYDVTMEAPNHTFAVNGGIMTCNSHAVAYAYIAYWTMWCKAHKLEYFYTKWLDMAKEKVKPHEEIRELVNDAKAFDVEILPPDFRELQPRFSTDALSIRFGLNDIKGIGQGALDKIFRVCNEVQETAGPVANWSWYTFLTECSHKISSTAVDALIHSGALSYSGISRTRMAFEFDIWKQLTEKEKIWICEKRGEFETLLDALRKVQPTKKNGGGAHNPKRSEKLADLVKIMENPPSSLEDRADLVAYNEERLLGVSLSCSQLDICDSRSATITCKELDEGLVQDYMIVEVEVVDIREWKTKSGNNPGRLMGFLTAKDNTLTLDNFVVFPDQMAEFGNLLVEQNTVKMQITKDNKDSRNSLIVQKVWSI